MATGLATATVEDGEEHSRRLRRRVAAAPGLSAASTHHGAQPLTPRGEATEMTESEPEDADPMLQRLARLMER